MKRVFVFLSLCAMMLAVQACRKGATWNNGCNRCSCMKTNGGAACTRRGCPWGACKPGASWHDGCNRCWCVQPKDKPTFVACTLMACIDRTITRPETRPNNRPEHRPRPKVYLANDVN